MGLPLIRETGPVLGVCYVSGYSGNCFRCIRCRFHTRLRINS